MYFKSRLKIILYLFILSVNAKGQEIDSLKCYALENHHTFWRIVGNFYPFTKTEFEKFQAEIYVESNPNINWAKDLLLQNEINPYILRNKSIVWSEDLIEKIYYKKGFHFVDLLYNRKLTLSNAFLDKYPDLRENYKKFIVDTKQDSTTFFYEWDLAQIGNNSLYDFGSIVYDGLNNMKPSNLLDYYKQSKIYASYLHQNINDIPPYILDSLKKSIDEYKLTSQGKWNISWNKYLQLEEIFSRNNFSGNESIYNSLFKSTIDAEYLNKIYALHYQNESFFELNSYSLEDEYGSVPNFTIPNELWYMGQIQLEPNMIFELKGVHGGPVRFCDIYPMVEVGDDSRIQIMIVSSRLNEVFKKFNIPNHLIYPIKLYYDSPFYGSDTMDYVLYRFDVKSIEKNYILPVGTLLKQKKEGKYLICESKHTLISDPKTVSSFIASNEKYLNFKDVEYGIVKINEKLDIIPFGYQFLISPEMKAVLELFLLNNKRNFTKVTSPKFAFQLQDKKSYATRYSFVKKSLSNYNIYKGQKSIVIYNREVKKVKEFIKSTELYSKLKSLNLEVNNSNYIDSALNQFQIKSNVMLPESFITFMKTSKHSALYTRNMQDRDENEWELMSIKDFALIEKEWYEQIPQLYRAVVFARNGIGDYLVLLRNPKSEHEISNDIFVLWHETGQVENVKIGKKW